MSRIQQPSMEQIAAMSSLQEQQQMAQYQAEFRGMAGALFKEVAADYLKESPPEGDEAFLEELSIRCVKAAMAYHAAFGIWHGHDPEKNIDDVKQKRAELVAQETNKPRKGKIATE